MKISIYHNDTIGFSEFENLRRFQISQLEYYGYVSLGNMMMKRIDNLDSELRKILSYFESESIDVELSEEAQELLNKANRKLEHLNGVFQKATDIKDGKISKSDFRQFAAFTKTLPRVLKEHQLKSAFHFYTLVNGANFSVPGSGKTTTLLAVYEKLRLEGKCNLLFVIGPPSCFQPWQNEFYETIGRRPKNTILSGGNRSYRKSEYYRSSDFIDEIYLCSFHTALNDNEEIQHFLSQPDVNAFLVIDEAHYMKQLGGSWADALLKIGHLAVVKGILTGTPMPKSYQDLFNLFDFLWEENNPLTEDDKIQIGIWEKQNDRDSVKTLLDNRIGPLFYRVRKKDLGLKSANFNPPIIVQMKTIEREIYHSIKSKIFELDQADYFKNEALLSKLWRGRMIRLRQSVSHPLLLLSAVEEYSEDLLDDSDLQYKIQHYEELEVSGKISALETLVLQLRGEGRKVLIWSNFIKTIELIEEHLTNLGEGVGIIYGKTPIKKDDDSVISEEKTREEIREEFLDWNSGLDILVANPGACAESISLHKSCFDAIYFDLSYNGAQFLQSLDRIHRVGGSEKNQASYYFLEYEDSIDRDIKQNLDAKAQKMYDIIEEDYGIYNLDMFEEIVSDDLEAYSRLFNKQ